MAPDIIVEYLDVWSGENVYSNVWKLSRMKQTRMYVCTFEEFILVDIWILCCTSWN